MPRKRKWARSEPRARLRCDVGWQAAATAAAAKTDLLAARRVAYRKYFLRIPNFAKALPPPGVCEHKKIKYWSTQYGKGQRCLECNRELTESHLWHDPFPTEFDKQVEAHRCAPACVAGLCCARPQGAFCVRRRNSGVFEARKTEELLGRIEDERVRLEKEERLVHMVDVIFNDSEYTESFRKEDLVRARSVGHHQCSNARVSCTASIPRRATTTWCTCRRRGGTPPRASRRSGTSAASTRGCRRSWTG